MALEINSHVERLSRFQPFNADAAELVHEQADSTEFGFETAAYKYVVRVIEDPSVRLIVLTGDAGHGKTHLCAQVLRACGADPDSATDMIRNHARGDEVLTYTPSTSRPVRIVKDLSDFSVETGANLFESLMSKETAAVSIVCANEGRLRRAAGAIKDNKLSRALIRTLEDGINNGSCSSTDPAIHVVNLNYQSVVKDDGNGLMEWAAATWAVDRRRWRACQKCDAREMCPIFRNHTLLADSELGPVRRKALKDLFSTAERSGTVITIRHALATLAYAVTGGIRCTDVHRRFTRNRADLSWQYKHLFHEALFGDRLTQRQRSEVPTFAALRRLDPGATAIRAVDDLLDPLDGNQDFLPAIPVMDGGTPRSRRDAQRESETMRELFSYLRRRSYFDYSRAVDSFARMGLRAGGDFQAAATGELSDHRGVRTRDVLMRGLEAVQGIRRSGNPADLLILDPAFANYRSRAAVVGTRLASRNVNIQGQIGHWMRGNSRPTLPTAVDWLSRSAIVQIVSPKGGETAIPIDLFRFELLQRWAAGLSARAEHAAAIRFINGLLASVVPESQEEDEIVVLVGGERKTLSIDLGDRIRSGDL
jgi:hypothetical protein